MKRFICLSFILSISSFSLQANSQHLDENCFEEAETIRKNGEKLIAEAEEQMLVSLNKLNECNTYLVELLPRIAGLQSLCSSYQEDFLSKEADYAKIKKEIEDGMKSLSSRDSNGERIRINALIVKYNKFMNDIGIAYDRHHVELHYFEKVLKQARGSCDDGFLLLKSGAELYLSGLQMIEESNLADENLVVDDAEIATKTRPDKDQYYFRGFYEFKDLKLNYELFVNSCYFKKDGEEDFRKFLSLYLRDMKPLLAILLSQPQQKINMTSIFQLTMKRRVSKN